ncbi:hypothetical protein H113_03412, partial [Trichophyton rubrum MR1459]
MHARVRERVHIVHHQRSFGEVSGRETQDCQWGGYPLCHDIARIRKLRRSLEDLPHEIPGNPNCQGRKPEPTIQQRIWLRWPSWRSRSSTRRHGRNSTSSTTTSGLHSPSTPRGFQQPS